MGMGRGGDCQCAAELFRWAVWVRQYYSFLQWGALHTLQTDECIHRTLFTWYMLKSVLLGKKHVVIPFLILTTIKLQPTLQMCVLLGPYSLLFKNTFFPSLNEEACSPCFGPYETNDRFHWKGLYRTSATLIYELCMVLQLTSMKVNPYTTYGQLWHHFWTKADMFSNPYY